MQPHSPARPVIAALLPMVWSVRNIVHAGVMDDVIATARLQLLMPGATPVDTATSLGHLPPGAEVAALLEAVGRAPRGKPLVDAVLASGFCVRKGIGSHRLYQNWWQRHASRRERVRSGLVAVLGAASARSDRLLTALQMMSSGLYRLGHELRPVQTQLSMLEPDLLWSTVCVSPLEYPYLLAARRLGIPTVASILSFDNLTSRAALPTYDHYLVWSEAMKAELLRLYPRVPAVRVLVTGTPQFDFHRSPDCRWPRGQTLEALKLSPDASYLLYAASHEQLAPDEPALVTGVRETLDGRAELREAFLVVRLHPLDDGPRWSRLAAHPRVRLERAWSTPTTRDGWTVSSRDDQARLVSLLLHADACLNVASTMTLDAAILDRPVIGLELSAEPGAPREIMYSEYRVDHYRPLVESGGLRLARSWLELADLVAEARRTPERDRDQRAAMVRAVCGEVDGRAAQRVAAAILRIVGAGSPAAGEPPGPRMVAGLRSARSGMRAIS